MEFAHRALAALCLLAAISSANGVLSVKVAARSSLRRAAQARVQTNAESLFAVETILSLANVTKAKATKVPATVAKAKETKVLASLESEVAKLEGNVANIAKMDKEEHSKEAEKKNKDLRDHMKGADQKMLDKMDEWGKRMNRKTRLGAMDVLSKLKNAIHLVKKGALTGNKDASDSLNNVLATMGAMAGQPTGGKFLH